jgi:hybrid cluster-associated redox disulfide protein
MKHPQLEANLIVAEVLARWPQTIPVFIRHRMACVGCAMAPFETLSEIAAVYKLDLDRFLNELQQAADFEPAQDRKEQNPIQAEAIAEAKDVDETYC